MRNSTKLYIETELNLHTRVDMEACAKNGYDWLEYFVNKNITEKDLEYINKCFYSYFANTKPEEYDENIGCDFLLIQLRVAEALFKNQCDLNKIRKAHLLMDPDFDLSGDWADNPGYEESYRIGGDTFLILEADNADYILRVESDYYDNCDLSLERADFVAKFEE